MSRGIAEPVDMAGRTRGCRMGSGEDEPGLCMVEGGVLPAHRIVAHLAILRILLGFVVAGIIILNLVAADTLRGGTHHAAFMAICTLCNAGVATRQNEAGAGMVECRWLPGGCIMAGFANRWQSRRCMIRNLGRAEIRTMAGITGGWRSAETRGVATAASHGGMRAGERKCCLRMIKGSIKPIVGIMAKFTVGRVRLRLMVPGTVVLCLVA